MTLGQKIKEARLSRGMTQKELVGDAITRNMLSKIENDSAAPSMRTLEYLAGALGLPAGYFLDQAPISDGTVPDGLDEARAAYRQRRWSCLLYTSLPHPGGGAAARPRRLRGRLLRPALRADAGGGPPPGPAGCLLYTSTPFPTRSRTSALR